MGKRKERLILPHSFLSIDFETADQGRDSACSVAIVKVENLQIVGTWHRLIRPPRRYFQFTYLHGIAWEHVVDQPTFPELWRDFERELQGFSCLFAHNAGFDQSVMRNCCEAAGIIPPTIPFRCTVQLAREQWDIFPTKLPDVCRKLNIPLKHHDAGSDAEACARIVIAAAQERAKVETEGLV